MKNKKKLIITFIILLVIITISINSFEKVIEFDEYVEVEIENPTINISPLKLKDSTIVEFYIYNLKDGMFIVLDVKSNDNINFLDTKKKDLIDKSQFFPIYAKIYGENLGKFDKEIKVICNSKKGNITLKIKGETIK